LGLLERFGKTSRGSSECGILEIQPLCDAKLGHEVAVLSPNPYDLRPLCLCASIWKLRHGFESIHGCSTARKYISISRGIL